MPEAHRSRLSPAEARQLRPRLQRLIRDASQTDLGPSPTPDSAAPFWELDPSAIVIETEEWKRLSLGLVQRARLVNALLRDLYGDQNVLRERVIPPEIVLSDPYYRRPCRRLETARLAPATIMRVQLLKSSRGWIASSVATNTPIGLSYAVQNRRFLSQEARELYSALPDYHSIINFPLRLLEALRALAPEKTAEPTIVVLTAGPQDPFYAEHSFLARKMGLPLARGEDLLVVDNRVYFKTIAGLEPVDVIYRRLNDAHIDPVVFPTPRQGAGVPGLLNCVRQGSVAVANAIGTGVAENRAFDAFLPILCRFYLGEDLLLPGWPTHLVADTEALEATLAKPGKYFLRPVHDLPGNAAAPEPIETGRLPPVSRGCEYSCVVQDLTDRESTDDDSHPALAAFVLAQGNRYEVLPGGLARFEIDADRENRVGRTADVVVQQDQPPQTASASESSPRRAALATLGSRAAEHLYWLGRYLERAEATARMVSIFDDVALEEIPRRDRMKWLPVWQGLLEATGHGGGDSRSGPLQAGSSELTWRMTLESGHPSSIVSSIDAAAENARQLRDCLSPEVWTVLSQLRDRLQDLRAPARDADTRDERTRAAVHAVLIDANAWWGTAERTLLQDSTWHFLRIGAHLERAIMTCSALRHILNTLDAAAGSSPAVLEYDNPELSALIRMLGSQDAYRRLYQAPSLPRLVTDLFLEQTAAPRSLRHNLQEILRSLEAIRADAGAADLGLDVTRRVAELIDFLPTVKFAEQAAPQARLGQRWAELLTGFFSVHTLLSDHYFSHQARLGSMQLSML